MPFGSPRMGSDPEDVFKNTVPETSKVTVPKLDVGQSQ